MVARFALALAGSWGLDTRQGALSGSGRGVTKRSPPPMIATLVWRVGRRQRPSGRSLGQAGVWACVRACGGAPRPRPRRSRFALVYPVASRAQACYFGNGRLGDSTAAPGRPCCHAARRCVFDRNLTGRDIKLGVSANKQQAPACELVCAARAESQALAGITPCLPSARTRANPTTTRLCARQHPLCRER